MQDAVELHTNHHITEDVKLRGIRGEPAVMATIDDKANFEDPWPKLEKSTTGFKPGEFVILAGTAPKRPSALYASWIASRIRKGKQIEFIKELPEDSFDISGRTQGTLELGKVTVYDKNLAEALGRAKPRTALAGAMVEHVRDMLASGEAYIEDIKHEYEPGGIIVQEEVPMKFESPTGRCTAILLRGRSASPEEFRCELAAGHDGAHKDTSYDDLTESFHEIEWGMDEGKGSTVISEYTNIDREQIRALAEHLNKTPLFAHEEGDYWEEDENGVVFLRRKNGAPVLMMSRADYDEMEAHRAAKDKCP